MAKTKIQLTRDVPASDAHKGFTAKKVVIRIGDHWMDAEWGTLKSQTMETFVREGVRFMVECELHGERCYIVTHAEDQASLKAKYPECSIIYLSQIIGLLAGLPRKVEGFEVVPELLIEFGAEVIGHGEVKKEKSEQKQTGITFKAGAVDHGVDEVPGVAV